MERRDFLKTLSGTAAAGVLTAGPVRAAEAGLQKPNILLVMSDEHTASITGCYGNTIVRTPQLDKLAAQGITFEACYTPSPLCVPARLAFTAGRYISRVGAWANSSWMDEDDPDTLPRVLNAAGYDTVLCGKMHYDPDRRYGFRTDLGIGNHSRKNGHVARRQADDLTPKPGISGRFKDFRVGDEQKNGVMRHDLQVTEKAAAYLQARKPGDMPFFMLAGYLAPHFPLIVPEAYWKKYRDKVPMPVIPKGHLEQLPLNYKHLRIGFNNEDVPDDIVKRGRELYYGFVEWFDRQVGLLLAALEKSADADNTVVIYTSDHGEDLGEHGLWWKNCMYEHAARVPLIVSWPPRWAGGQRRTAACTVLDVVATIAEIAGGKTPECWDGDSMTAWLDSPKAPWRDWAISQYYAHNIASGYVMLRQGRYKYVYHSPPDAEHGAEEELYDLTADPGEFNNLAKRPEHRQRMDAMLAAIVRETGEHPDAVEERCREQGREGYGRQAAKRTFRNRFFGQQARYWEARGTAGRYAVLDGIGRDGKPGLRFHKPADAPEPITENSHFDQTADVPPNTEYRLGMWVKAEGDLRPVVRVADAKSQTVAEAVAGPSRDWQLAETTFNTAKHSSLKLQIFGGAKGKIHQTAPGTSFFDCVIIEPVKE